MIYTIDHGVSHYSEIEIHGVVFDLRDDEPEECGCWIEDNVNPDQYSVYLRIAEGEYAGQLECIADFDAANDARTYALNLSRLTGWPIINKLKETTARYDECAHYRAC